MISRSPGAIKRLNMCLIFSPSSILDLGSSVYSAWLAIACSPRARARTGLGHWQVAKATLRRHPGEDQSLPARRPWYYGTMVLRHLGSMVTWYPRAVLPWYHGTMVVGYHGTVIPGYHGTLAPWLLWCHDPKIHRRHQASQYVSHLFALFNIGLRFFHFCEKNGIR